MIEPLNQLHSSSEKFLVGDSLPCPSLQYLVDSIAVLAAKFVVRDVRIVNNLGDDRHFVIANPKVLLQCLEGAIVAAVSEPILLEHIEWYGSARYAFFRRGLSSRRKNAYRAEPYHSICSSRMGSDTAATIAPSRHCKRTLGFAITK